MHICSWISLHWKVKCKLPHPEFELHCLMTITLCISLCIYGHNDPQNSSNSIHIIYKKPGICQCINPWTLILIIFTSIILHIPSCFVFITTHSGCYFCDSEKQHEEETRIKNKYLMRFKLILPSISSGKSASMNKLLY